MKPIVPLLTSAAMIFVAGQAHAQSRSFDLDGFEYVSASTGISVTIDVGDEFAIIAEGDEDDLAELDLAVRDNELFVRRKNKRKRWRSGRVTVNVSMPTLSGLDSSSGASIDASGVESDDFNIDSSSGSSIDVTGSCGTLNVDSSSGSNIEADRLECRSVIADASSGSSIDVYAGERINADASSGASIRVYGSPTKVYKDTSSGASVKIRDRK